MTRRTVTVQLDSRSAVLDGPRVWAALERSQARWMKHEHARRGGAVRVHLDDLDDVLAALQLDGQLVQFVDRDGAPLAAGGLLGWADAG